MERRTLYGLIGGGVALVVAAVAAVPLLAPTTAVRAQIETEVGHATGRAFKINGAFSFSLFPALGFDARDVTLANVPGGRARAMVRVARMRIAVKLWPLLSGRVEAGEIVLEKPIIALEVSRDGTANWELVQTHTPNSGLRLPPGTRFAGLRIEDGAVSYDNDRLDIHRAISSLDAKVTLTQLGRPVRASGSFDFLGRRLDYIAKVATPDSLLAGRATNADIALSADFLHAGFLGFVSSDGTAKGSVSLRTASLKDLAAWLGHPIAAGSGLGPLTALANIAAKDQRLVMTAIQAKLDGMAVSGALTADTRGKIPDVTASLVLDRLDLNTYLALGGRAQTGPQRVAGPPSGGWSKTPVKLDLIKLLNGHLTLNVGALSVLHLKTGRTAIAVTLQDGSMTAHLGPMQLYGGSGVADLAVDGRGAIPAVANRLTFTGIAMGTFLADTIGVDKLDGRGTIVLNVTAKGATPDAIMRALSGKGTVSIGRGSVHGVDMGQVARTIQTILSAGATGRSATTNFDRFGGSFSISNGMLWNGDLRLDSPFLHMKGAGHLDLGNQTIAYRIEPKASIGGRLNLLSVGVPFAITGPWSHVHYAPDLAGAVTGLVGSVIDKGTAPITGLFNGLTGSGKPSPKKKNKDAGDTLKGIFGLH
ncbi:MAG TPA: AsmA family protein [Rhizomicrobium sp.]